MQKELYLRRGTAWRAVSHALTSMAVVTVLWISVIEAKAAQTGRDYLLPGEGKGGFISLPASTESGSHSTTKSSGVSYRAFDGSSHQLLENRGKYVNVLIPQAYSAGVFFTDDHIAEMVDRLDMLYVLYTELLQGQPNGDGLLTIAFVPQTCGMGCGRVGARGFEVLSDPRNYEAIIRELDAGRLEPVLLHEMAHNFDIPSTFLHYLPDHPHAWTDMFEFFAPFRYSRVSSHDESPDDLYNSPVSAVWKTYVTEDSANWTNCVINAACGDLGLSANNLWAMLYYRVEALHGIDALLGSFEFLKDYAKTHAPPMTVEAKESVRILSLAEGAGVNIACYMDALKWPIEASLRNELEQKFGSSNEFCADRDGDGFNAVNGDCDDTNALRNIATTEIASNGIDEDCDELVDELHLIEATSGAGDDNFDRVVQTQLPFEVEGSSATIDDRDSFKFPLPATGRTRVTLCARGDFKGWVVATLADGSFLQADNWNSYQPAPGCISNTFDYGTVSNAGLVVIADSALGDYSLSVTPAIELLPDHSAFVQVVSKPSGGVKIQIEDSDELFSKLGADEIEIWISAAGVQLFEPFSTSLSVDLTASTAPALQDGQTYQARIRPRANGLPLAAFSAGHPFLYERGPSQLPTIDHRFSGAWFDPEHSGEGFIVEILDDGRVVVYWFTYQQDGSQRWMIGIGEIADNRIVINDLMDAHGGRFGEDFNPDDVVLKTIGSMTLNFLDCSTALVSYSVDNNGAHQNTSRLTRIYGHNCEGGDEEQDSGINGSWFDPSHSGEGFVVEQINSDEAVVFWFTYDDTGEQSWMFNVGSIEDGAIHVSDLLQPKGGHFGRSFDPDTVTHYQWGELNLDLDCSGGIASYTTTTEGYSSGSQSLVRLTRLAGSACTD